MSLSEVRCIPETADGQHAAELQIGDCKALLEHVAIVLPDYQDMPGRPSEEARQGSPLPKAWMQNSFIRYKSQTFF